MQAVYIPSEGGEKVGEGRLMVVVEESVVGVEGSTYLHVLPSTTFFTRLRLAKLLA